MPDPTDAYLLFAGVVLPCVLVIGAEWWLVRHRPHWLARFAFLPVVPSRTVPVNEELLRSLRARSDDAGYRDAAVTEADPKRIAWPATLEGAATKVAMPPCAGFGVASAASLLHSRSSTSIARIGIRFDEGRAILSARALPSLTWAYLFAIPWIVYGATHLIYPGQFEMDVWLCTGMWAIPVGLVFILRTVWEQRRLRPSAVWAMDEIARRLATPDPGVG